MLNIESLHLHDSTLIVPSMSVCDLGVVFDSGMSMAEHVNNITNSCFYQLRQLCSVHRSFSNDTTKLVVHALILSRVDYCNSLLFFVSPHVLHFLQAVMNAAACLITGPGCFNHITPTLRDELHWLPVRQQIGYKLALLVHKCLHVNAPSYLSNCCLPLLVDSLWHGLRSVIYGDLQQLRTRT